MQAQGKELGRPLAAAEPVLAETAGLEQTKSSTDLEKLPDVQEGEDLKKQATEGSLHFRDGGYVRSLSQLFVYLFYGIISDPLPGLGVLRLRLFYQFFDMGNEQQLRCFSEFLFATQLF